MKLVGEAVAEELHEYDTNLTVLGIATWGVIKDKELLINPVNPLFICIIKEKMILPPSYNENVILIKIILRCQRNRMTIKL